MRFGTWSLVGRSVAQVGVCRSNKKIAPDAGLPLLSDSGHRISNTHRGYYIQQLSGFTLLRSTLLFPLPHTSPRAPLCLQHRAPTPCVRAYAVIYGAPLAIRSSVLVTPSLIHGHVVFGINSMIVLSQNSWPLNELGAGSGRLIMTKNICESGVTI